MISFIRKDMQLMIRDKKELAILILMPFLLIAILSFALGGFIQGAEMNLQLNYALVNEDDEVVGKLRLIEEIQNSAAWSEEAKKRLVDAVHEIQPHAMLYALLEHEEFAAFAEYTVMDLEDARLALYRDEFAAILHIPPDYTYDMLKKMVLSSGDGAVIGLVGSAEYAISSGILHDIIDRFADEVNFQTTLQQISAEHGSVTNAEELVVGSQSVHGGVESISVNEPINSMQYYTLGMAVMFVMYVATSIAGKAYDERMQFTFDRIIIAGSHPLKFLSGKFISTVILAFMQLTILFLLSTLVFQSFAGKPLEFWLGMLTVTAALALCMGGLSTLLTSLSFRAGNEHIMNIFNSLIVTILAFIGGSFFPTSQMAEWMAALSSWMPNGTAQYAYIQVTQGAELDRYLHSLIRLIGMAGIFIAVSLWVFPRRKEW